MSQLGDENSGPCDSSADAAHTLLTSIVETASGPQHSEADFSGGWIGCRREADVQSVVSSQVSVVRESSTRDHVSVLSEVAVVSTQLVFTGALTLDGGKTTCEVIEPVGLALVELRLPEAAEVELTVGNGPKLLVAETERVADALPGTDVVEEKVVVFMAGEVRLVAGTLKEPVGGNGPNVSVELLGTCFLFLVVLNLWLRWSWQEDKLVMGSGSGNADGERLALAETVTITGDPIVTISVVPDTEVPATAFWADWLRSRGNGAEEEPPLSEALLDEKLPEIEVVDSVEGADVAFTTLMDNEVVLMCNVGECVNREAFLVVDGTAEELVKMKVVEINVVVFNDVVVLTLVSVLTDTDTITEVPLEADVMFAAVECSDVVLWGAMVDEFLLEDMMIVLVVLVVLWPSELEDDDSTEVEVKLLLLPLDESVIGNEIDIVAVESEDIVVVNEKCPFAVTFDGKTEEQAEKEGMCRDKRDGGGVPQTRATFGFSERPSRKYATLVLIPSSKNGN
ncbi:hypothetical protein M406DRAFT_327156 [Cryphonectria parasitica EP155]|uniref:Uncharacterized protein n=1 Tax=Cryphonectria parasitica (strain ATCC 38755 / EP155) TaxID=660469 RepID=A0A9P4Y8K4_CRYP1|nr:uncharacterized protein M406DRAFT_327156 [Cryphonectria parasitica EP155]KAF3768736.1 hypothetical protein M406DRAFT_327156 [Cryphonectria parasitica EP155]